MQSKMMCNTLLCGGLKDLPVLISGDNHYASTASRCNRKVQVTEFYIYSSHMKSIGHIVWKALYGFNLQSSLSDLRLKPIFINRFAELKFHV